MVKMMFVFGLIALSLIASGKCDEIDCAKIPIENLEPCKAFLSDKTVANKKSPNRLSFKPNKIRIAAIPFECQVPEFYKYVSCLAKA
ncbi:hypothetical protein Pfo_021406 [Paulownia fortunei]|nr:hypothetical protein Pfo_021406 [Paulownia fortunei]